MSFVKNLELVLCIRKSVVWAAVIALAPNANDKSIHTHRLELMGRNPLMSFLTTWPTFLLFGRGGKMATKAEL